MEKFFASSRRRREITLWLAEHIAGREFVCDQCDTPINATTVYHRRVFAVGFRVEVERIHAKPNCPNRAY